MKALVFRGPGRRLFEPKPLPAIVAATDAIIRVTHATICGSDQRATRNGAGPVAHGRIMGHEGTGIVERVGDGVTRFRAGDRVLISCLTSCGTCAYCSNGERERCENGGFLLGNAIDGTYAEYVRVPFADNSLFPVPGAGDDKTDGPWINNFAEGFIRDVLLGPDEDTDAETVVYGGSVGMGALLAVMEYNRTVVVPALRSNGDHNPGPSPLTPRWLRPKLRLAKLA